MEKLCDREPLSAPPLFPLVKYAENLRKSADHLHPSREPPLSMIIIFAERQDGLGFFWLRKRDSQVGFTMPMPVTTEWFTRLV
jgi:hypothetical protein